MFKVKHIGVCDAAHLQDVAELWYELEQSLVYHIPSNSFY
jgi:hypothetical protein